MLRIGPPNAIHTKVRDISLQNLIIKRVKENSNQDSDQHKTELHFRQSKINSINNTIIELKGINYDFLNLLTIFSNLL